MVKVSAFRTNLYHGNNIFLKLFALLADDSSEGSGVPSAHQQPLTHPSHQEGVLKEGCSFRMDEVDENLQQLSALNKVHTFFVIKKNECHRIKMVLYVLQLLNHPH